jgi:hypothetical protein
MSATAFAQWMKIHTKTERTMMYEKADSFYDMWFFPSGLCGQTKNPFKKIHGAVPKLKFWNSLH